MRVDGFRLDNQSSLTVRDSANKAAKFETNLAQDMRIHVGTPNFAYNATVEVNSSTGCLMEIAASHKLNLLVKRGGSCPVQPGTLATTFPSKPDNQAAARFSR